MLIDSHAHLPKDIAKTKAILARAKENGVEKIINIGTSIQTNIEGIHLANTLNDVYTTIAIYPNEDQDKNIDALKEQLEKQLILSKKIVAIGECGMDITAWTGQREIAEQYKLFEMQIKLALKNNLPIVIHNRNGDKHVLELVQKYYKQGLRGIAHCFTQNLAYAKELLKYEFYISFSGFITHNSKSYLLEIVKEIPFDKILVETDAPYILPKGIKDRENESKNVKMVVEKIAQAKNVSFETIAKCTYNNTCAIFKLNL